MICAQPRGAIQRAAGAWDQRQARLNRATAGLVSSRRAQRVGVREVSESDLNPHGL
jgi:hypothetical protein